MYSPVWEAADAKLLKACRHTSGLSEAEFARSHSISVLQLRELEGQGARHFYTDDIKTRTGLRVLSKYGHVKYIPPLVVRNELRPDVKRVRATPEEVTETSQRNRREVTMLGSCVALVMGVFVALPQIEGNPDAQLAANRPASNPGVQYANTLTGKRPIPQSLPGIEVPAQLQDTQTALVPDALPPTAAGPTGSGVPGNGKNLSEEMKKNLASYFQATTPEPGTSKP